MAFLFGGARQTNTNTLKDYQRKMTSSARGMEREVSRMDTQEASLQRELAKCAKEGKLDVAAAKAKEIVRLRANRSRVNMVKGHMTGLSQQLQSVESTAKIQETMGMTAQMLHALNSRFDASAVARMLSDFEKQNAHMVAKQELINDTLDSGFEADGEQDDCNEAVIGVLNEAGLDVQARLTRPSALCNLSVEEIDIAQRLERLRTS
jgi:hypothetical protein